MHMTFGERIAAAANAYANAFASVRSAFQTAAPVHAERVRAARALSELRAKNIRRLAGDDRVLASAALTMRRQARGPSKLARRLRRKGELGMAGAH